MFEYLGENYSLVHLHFSSFFRFIHPLKTSVGFGEYGLVMVGDGEFEFILLQGYIPVLPCKEVA